MLCHSERSDTPRRLHLPDTFPSGTGAGQVCAARPRSRSTELQVPGSRDSAGESLLYFVRDSSVATTAPSHRPDVFRESDMVFYAVVLYPFPKLILTSLIKGSSFDLRSSRLLQNVTGVSTRSKGSFVSTFAVAMIGRPRPSANPIS